MELAIFADGGESFLLNRRRAQFDSREDGRIQDVDASVDAVAHKLNRLLDEAVNTRGMIRFMNDNTIFAGLLNFGDNDCTLIAVGFMESGELLEGVVTGDV